MHTDEPSFLEDDNNADLIQWSPDGKSFIITNEEAFSRKLLPELFKHSNFASFVRQLNMYGFHKKVGLSDNSMRASERKSKLPSEYTNPFFQRGRPNLLWLIQKPKLSNPKSRGGKSKPDGSDEEVDEVFGRNSPVAGDFPGYDRYPYKSDRPQHLLTLGNGSLPPTQPLAGIQAELQAIRDNQQKIAQVLADVKREQQSLYGQAKFFQDQHQKHDNSINAILQFLASVYQKNINEMPSQEENQRSGVLGEVREHSEEIPTPPPLKKKTPLLLSDGKNAAFNDARPPSSDANGWTYSGNSNHRSPQVRELTPSPKISPQKDRTNQTSQADIMSMLKSQSAQNNAFSPGTPMDFGDALQQLQNTGNSTPLSPRQRNNMLQLLGDDTAYPDASLDSNIGSNGSDVVSQYNNTGQQIDQISQLLREQNQSIDDITNRVAPLSPSGSIPGLDLGSNNGGGFGDPGLLDLEQIFDAGGYFGEVREDGDNNFVFDDSGFDFGAAAAQSGGEENDEGAGLGKEEKEDGKERMVTPVPGISQATAGKAEEMAGQSLGKRRRVG